MSEKDMSENESTRTAGSAATSGTDESVALSIRDLNLTIDDHHILKDVSLDVPSGKVMGLAGESGSGKTMTGMTVLGLQPEGAEVTGEIDYHGENLLALNDRQMASYRGHHIAMVFQDPTASLHPMIRIGVQLTDHMRHHLGLSKQEARERAIELLKLVQVPDPEGTLKRYPHQFSGGQLQRIAIAVAIACKPDLIIADEPTTALDVTVQAGILQLLRHLCDTTGLTIILITHDLGVMSALADEIAVMRGGQIVERGSRYDVIRNPQHPYTKALIDSLPKQMMERRDQAAQAGQTAQAESGETEQPSEPQEGGQHD
ncbi:ABC transporter ATP-binding protein [Bifidobacterium simiarum]|nr:ABC transporter ATP-binding protein [Bifidobacterium simiarum]